MTISQIEISNIKGISQECFKVQLKAHKPNLLVAPNGFGKSSVATAFSSMNTKRIDLAEKDHHKEDENLAPKLSITVDGQTLTADRIKNEIRQQFDVLVINSGLTPKAKKHFKGAVSSSLEVNPITICKIPAKAEFPYKPAESKEKFGENGKILPNISDLLKDSRLLKVAQGSDLSKFTQKRIQVALTALIERINQQNDTAVSISQWILANCIDDLHAVTLLSEMGNQLVQLGLANSEVEGFFAAYQIASIHSADPKGFSASLKWLKYTAAKAHYVDLLSNFKSSNWQWARVEEAKKKKELVIIFPKAHQLSNGQRDIITLVVQLHKTLYEGSKKPLILVIDEVFDYLDDANLVAFQYYVTSIIEAYKDRGQVIYPIILTHLDPGVFFDFCFNKHKIQINYLQAKPTGKSQGTLRLIEARDTQEKIKDKLEKHWFHFHIDPCEISEHEWPNNLQLDWRSSEVFHNYTQSELTRYLEDKNYDTLAVCFALRIAVEKLGCSLLPQANQKGKFLEVRKTNNKMDFVAQTGVDIPESYFLLGLVYNTNLHWNQGRDYVSPLSSKLNHPTIKQLISDVANSAFTNGEQA
jgi:energy-coupling factor transporter ATP-binding protein EcfA2